jgi:hypothetical protein
VGHPAAEVNALRIRRFALAALLAAIVFAIPASAAPRVVIARNLSLELVGQVVNTPAGAVPATSAQFGFVSYLLGLAIFKGEPENETTALFTFYIDANTIRVISDGPLRVVTRQGTMTVYRNPGASASFDNPASFRRGTPVLVAGFRQQVVIDTVAGTFSTRNLDRITATKPFPAGEHALQLGVVGARFVTVLTGHLNMPGPPSAYFAGYTFSQP